MSAPVATTSGSQPPNLKNIVEIIFQALFVQADADAGEIYKTRFQIVLSFTDNKQFLEGIESYIVGNDAKKEGVWNYVFMPKLVKLARALVDARSSTPDCFNEELSALINCLRYSIGIKLSDDCNALDSREIYRVLERFAEKIALGLHN